MAKLNFNVPVLEDDGTEAKRAKTDKDNLKINAQGQIYAPFIKTGEGAPVMETIQVKELLQAALNAKSEDDTKISFGDQVRKNRLVRKIVSSSTANYRTEELEMIKSAAGKYGSVSLIGQLEDIIEGTEAKDGAGDDTSEGGEGKEAA